MKKTMKGNDVSELNDEMFRLEKISLNTYWYGKMPMGLSKPDTVGNQPI